MERGETMFLHKSAKDCVAAVARWFARFLATVLLSFLGLTFLLGLFLIALQKFRVFREWERRFNKRTLNPAVLNLAGRSSSLYAVVHHVGRRSGRTYATPVRVRPTPEGFIIPLPYGRDVDWCRNILAAGRCTISWHGNDYPVGEPEVIDLATAVSLVPLPGWRARLWGSFLSRGPLSEVPFLRVKRLSDIPAEAIAEA
jgi:deazaflavin-dependent oxidoreductase (nitroreductase family)